MNTLTPDTPTGTPITYRLQAGSTRTGIYTGRKETRTRSLTYYMIEHPETGTAVMVTPAEVRPDPTAELELLARLIPAAFDAADWPALTAYESARHRLHLQATASA